MSPSTSVPGCDANDGAVLGQGGVDRVEGVAMFAGRGEKNGSRPTPPPARADARFVTVTPGGRPVNDDR